MAMWCCNGRVCLSLQGTLLIRGRYQRLETPPGKTSATKFCGSKQFPAMTAWHKLSCHERGVPEVGFRLVRTNNQPNHGAVRSQSPQEGPRARRGARRWSRVLGLRNARWGRGAGARTAHRTSTSRHRVYSNSHVGNPCRSVASQEAGVGVFASAPWKKGSRGGGAEGKTKPASAVFFKRPPMASHVPLP